MEQTVYLSILLILLFVNLAVVKLPRVA